MAESAIYNVVEAILSIREIFNIAQEMMNSGKTRNLKVNIPELVDSYGDECMERRIGANTRHPSRIICLCSVSSPSVAAVSPFNLRADGD